MRLMRCALCGRDGSRGYETMPVAALWASAGWIGGQLVELPPTTSHVYVCAARSSCRRRRGMRP
jgi:hypothetical protein